MHNDVLHACMMRAGEGACRFARVPYYPDRFVRWEGVRLFIHIRGDDDL